jgi:hypothetical protein
MSELENNGLKKTPRGQTEQVKSNLDLTLSGKNIKQITIEDCTVINVSGVYSFGVFNYLPVDKGSIMVDVLLPPGKKITDSDGTASRVASNVRVRLAEDSLSTHIGTLKDDFLFDENGNPRMGDLIIKNYNGNNVSHNGEFIFKKCTKRYGKRNGYNNEKATLLGDKVSPSFSALYGTLDKDAATKYREMYIEQIKKGDYYG